MILNEHNSFLPYETYIHAISNADGQTEVHPGQEPLS